MAKKTQTGPVLQGVARLITEATTGIADLVEAVHKRIVHPPFLPSTPIQDLITAIAGITYKNIRWSTQAIGGGLDKALGKLTPVLGNLKSTDEGEAIRSVLNGLVGDYLEQKENPLQLSMQFRYQSNTVPLDSKNIAAIYPNINGKILVMVHGSCMNDTQWTRKEHNHGTALAAALDKTPLFLLYNSGRHVSTNGQDFSELLEKLVGEWPKPLEEIVIVAHSMGGLVVRSAVHYGQQQKKTWTKKLKKIVFLGTPHRGAPMERTGNYIDAILETIPYSKPFARLGKVRSSGITDLRYGNLLDEDWQGNDRFVIQGDQRRYIPLPKRVVCYSIAGVVEKITDPLSLSIRGDGMVDVKSALGQHENPEKQLQFREKNTWVADGVSHISLLSDPGVYARIKAWLS